MALTGEQSLRSGEPATRRLHFEDIGRNRL